MALFRNDDVKCCSICRIVYAAWFLKGKKNSRDVIIEDVQQYMQTGEKYFYYATDS